MITLIHSNDKTIEIEMEIMNSDAYHNSVSIGRSDFPVEKLVEEHAEKENIQKERYVVEKNKEAVGIIDFTMNNPNDQTPWIGLLIVHQRYQQTGLGFEIYRHLEQIMKNKGAKKIRLGCYKANEKGLQFWRKQAYFVYKEIIFNEREMLCLEKNVEINNV